MVTGSIPFRNLKAEEIPFKVVNGHRPDKFPEAYVSAGEACGRCRTLPTALRWGASPQTAPPSFADKKSAVVRASPAERGSAEAAVKDLITRCWDGDYKKRPKFGMPRADEGLPDSAKTAARKRENRRQSTKLVWSVRALIPASLRLPTL